MESASKIHAPSTCCMIYFYYLNADPDEIPHIAAFHLGFHHLLVTKGVCIL